MIPTDRARRGDIYEVSDEELAFHEARQKLLIRALTWLVGSAVFFLGMWAWIQK